MTGDPTRLATAGRARTTRPDLREPSLLGGLDRRDRAALLVWLALRRMGELAPGADVAATSRAWYDELRLPGALAAGLHEAGFDEAEAWAIADLVRVLLSLPRPSGLRGPARDAPMPGCSSSGWPAMRSGPRSASTHGRGSSTSIASRFESDAARGPSALDAIDALPEGARAGRARTWRAKGPGRKPPTTRRPISSLAPVPP